MRLSSTVPALLAAALASACGGSAHRGSPPPHHVRPDPPPPYTQRVSAPRRAAIPVRALVTAETENRLLVVELPSGRVVQRIGLPSDPEDVAASPTGGVVVVTSAAAGKVTLLEGRPLRAVKIIGGFGAPHIVEIAPDGEYAYITDDAHGTVTVIDLAKRRVSSTIPVGAGAHHLCFDVKDHDAWVALGESARMLVLLSTQDPGHPRVAGHFPPPFPVHDLGCSSDGPRVWLTSATGPDVTVFDGFDYGVVFRVPVGPPPQHVVLQAGSAYLTSGYGGSIERVDASTGRILARASSPYGSFELAAGGGYVVTSSLLRGTLAIYTPALKLLRVVHLAPATREVAIAGPA